MGMAGGSGWYVPAASFASSWMARCSAIFLFAVLRDWRRCWPSRQKSAHQIFFFPRGKMVTCSPTRMRSGSFSFIEFAPIVTVEQQVEGFVPPDQEVLAALAEAAVETAFRDPVVDGF